MRLDPLRETCVQPAPKSRLAVSGPSRIKIKSQIKSTKPTLQPYGYRRVRCQKTQISQTPQIATLGGRSEGTPTKEGPDSGAKWFGYFAETK